MGEFSDAARQLSGAMDDLSDALDTLRGMGGYLDELFGDVANAMPALLRAADSLTQSFRALIQQYYSHIERKSYTPND